MRGESLSELGREEYCTRMAVDLCSMDAALHRQQRLLVTMCMTPKVAYSWQPPVQQAVQSVLLTTAGVSLLPECI